MRSLQITRPSDIWAAISFLSHLSSKESSQADRTPRVLVVNDVTSLLLPLVSSSHGKMHTRQTNTRPSTQISYPRRILLQSRISFITGRMLYISCHNSNTMNYNKLSYGEFWFIICILSSQYALLVSAAINLMYFSILILWNRKKSLRYHISFVRNES